MDYSDKKIIEHELAGPIAKAVCQWVKKNEVENPVSIHTSVVYPTCYADEQGLVHNGPLVTCNVTIFDEDYFDDDDDD